MPGHFASARGFLDHEVIVSGGGRGRRVLQRCLRGVRLSGEVPQGEVGSTRVEAQRDGLGREMSDHRRQLALITAVMGSFAF
jgi:hypothetical protein